jgi:predicted acyltransferase
LGIIQRISLCYGGLAVIHWATRYGEKPYRYVGATVAVLLGSVYVMLMLTFDRPEIGCPASENLSSFCNFGSYLDRLIFTNMHMIYPNDPEGLFTTLSAFLTGYIGYLFCLTMQDNKGRTLHIITLWTIISLALGAVVYPLTFAMPLNKKIWSISFVFVTAAIVGLSLAFVSLTVDMLGSKYVTYGKIIGVITRPFVWLGRNPLAIFVLMDALAIVMIHYITNSEGTSSWSLFYKNAFSSWIPNPEVASTLFACFFAILWTIVAGVMYFFNIFVRL